jgi:hypothetical protein
MKVSPRSVLLGIAVVVAVGAAVLPASHIYPTVLSLTVGLCAWAVVAFIKSAHFADTHFIAVWSVAVLLHVLMSLIPTFAIWLGLRLRKPGLCIVLMIGWCLCYLSLLLVLFRAPEGP